jgi:asparagine synthase (glutamine-hydrolysing)
MRARLGHRGPDADGLWTEGSTGAGIGFAHTRLAVIDLSPRAAQPMASADGRFVLCYNGEIYNFRELRQELAAKGTAFRSDSDTEVLLALLAQGGIAALDRLVGMFAFALWDNERRELTLARDRLGIKPLVYAPLEGGGVAFASEINALKAHPGIDLGTDGDALSAYLACLYVPAPATIYRGIRKLPPGHVLQWQGGTIRITSYWRPQIPGGRQLSTDNAAEELLPLLRRAVTDRLVADVPVGCFLSGGSDSALVAAVMAEEARRSGAPPIRTFTMTFDEAAYDERQRARQIADHIGADHTELAASPRLADRLDTIAGAFGEPFGNPTALLIDDLSEQARQHVTVALVGDGGDEVFAGYPRYAGGLLAQRYRRLPRLLREGVIGPAARLIPESTSGRHGLRRAREFLTSANLPDAEMYAAWVEYFSPGERRQLLGLEAAPVRPIAEAFHSAPSAQPLDAMQQTDLETFLPGNLLAYGDAMSMRHALELRLPLIDHRLVEAVGQIAPESRVADGLKGLLKAALRRLLPANLVDGPKRGFNPPLGVWLKGDLAPMLADRLTPASMADCGIDWPPVATLLAEFRRGGRDHSLKIWSLLALDAWRRTS